MNTDKSLSDILRWRRTSRRTPWPAWRDNRAYPPPPRGAELLPGQVALTFIGHASFLITTREATILADPVFSERVSPFARIGPKRVRPPGLALNDLPPVDLVLLSHNHYDHMDLPSLRALCGTGRGGPPILTGLGNADYLARRGVEGARDLDWWDQVQPRPGLAVTFVPAQHWSSRSLVDRRRTLWGGFVIDVGPTRIYVAGDTGFCRWFRVIAERCGRPDLALLPIGAYAPRWFMSTQHMDPEEAVRAHQALGARHSVGMHFGTVQLTDEGIDEPVQALARARQEAGVPEDPFTTLDVGETRVFDPAS